ncbi:MAG: HAD hydrolase family protein [Anaerotignum sp.]
MNAFMTFCPKCGRKASDLWWQAADSTLPWQGIFRSICRKSPSLRKTAPLWCRDGKELYFKGMNEKQIGHCLDIIDKLPETEALVCAKYCCYTENQEVYDLLASPKFHYDCELVDDLYKMTDGITKVSLMVYGNSTTQSCYDAMYPQMPEKMTLVISGDACLDTGIKGVTKGSALAALEEMWGISLKETLVFGDQFNDVEMFDQAICHGKRRRTV